MIDLAKAMLLYAITPSYNPNDSLFLKRIEGALAGGITCLQIREKDETLIKTEAYISLLGDISQLAQSYNVPFIINDWTDLAKEVNASGVHLGQDDGSIEYARQVLGSDAIIGVSAHNTEEACLAQKEGAHYLGVGALFPTNTKLDAELVSLEELRCITGCVDIPVVGIGGISCDNMKVLASSGIKGVAVVSAIFSYENTQKHACLLKEEAKKFFE